jgi:2-polyprenyl-3-methyl-5-hydroxy-6-metoxy-1,4-benzoquinol methylase
MLEISCPLCNSNNGDVVYPERLLREADEFNYLTVNPSHYRVLRCRSCRFCYSSPIYDEEEIANLYRQAEITNAVAVPDVAAISRNMRRYLRHLSGISGLRQGRLLDVGCGTGDLLEVAHDAGYTVTGVEPCTAAAEHAGVRFGCERILHGRYERSMFPENSFDAVTLVHVIDHVVHPLELLRAIFFHLRPGGHVLAATHNISSWLAMLTGENFIAYSVQHISYFNRRTFRMMLEAAGFEVLSLRGSLTSYPLLHYVENGIRNPALRSKCIQALTRLRLQERVLTFPFGNMEIVARKPVAGPL